MNLWHKNIHPKLPSFTQTNLIKPITKHPSIYLSISTSEINNFHHHHHRRERLSFWNGFCNSCNWVFFLWKLGSFFNGGWRLQRVGEIGAFSSSIWGQESSEVHAHDEERQWREGSVCPYCGRHPQYHWQEAIQSASRQSHCFTLSGMPCTCCRLVALFPIFKDMFWNSWEKRSWGICFELIHTHIICMLGVCLVWFGLNGNNFNLQANALNSEANALFTIRPREVK